MRTQLIAHIGGQGFHAAVGTLRAHRDKAAIAIAAGELDAVELLGDHRAGFAEQAFDMRQAELVAQCRHPVKIEEQGATRPAAGVFRAQQLVQALQGVAAGEQPSEGVLGVARRHPAQHRASTPYAIADR